MKLLGKSYFFFILITFISNFLYVLSAATLDPVTLNTPTVFSNNVVLIWDETTTPAADFYCYYVLRSTQAGFTNVDSIIGYPFSIPSLNITGAVVLILLLMFFAFRKIKVSCCIMLVSSLVFFSQGFFNAQAGNAWMSDCVSSDKTILTYADSGLGSPITYYYKVYVVGNEFAADGNYVASNEVSVTTNNLGVPSNISTAASNKQVTMSWSSVSEATSYNIYWSTLSGVTTYNGTKITGVTAPYAHSSLNNGTTYYYIVTAVNSSGESSASGEASAAPNTILISSIPFTDSNLATCVRDTGAIYASEISSLSCNSKSISDLSGIENITSLATLSLFDNNISDASPLASLIGLTYLSLGNNNISDASPLASLTGLTYLNLHNNSILFSDVSPLASLTRLTTLSLSSNNISDVSPLASLTSLSKLYLYGNNISDVSSLASLIGLTTLSLFSNNISNVSSLASLTGMSILSLHSNNITTGVASLVTLTNATYISFNFNYNIPCSDLTALVNALGKVVSQPSSCL